MRYEQLIVEIDDGVAVITLNNPRRQNALSHLTFGDDLPRVTEELTGRADVRVIVITGADGTFCGGAELDSDGFSRSTEPETIALIERVNRFPALLRDAPVPSIAAIDGVAIGGGVGIAAACDLRVGSPTSRFRIPYVALGLTPDVGITVTLPQIVGTSRALDLVLTGRWMEASEAAAAGLLTVVDDDPVGRAMAMARAIADSSPLAVSRARDMIVNAGHRPMTEALFEHEPVSHASTLHAPDRMVHFRRYLTSVGLMLDADGRIRRATPSGSPS
ncbi:enoyl-CoA hydratase/isomerase family protein [Georgenia sp. SYP-B2076]|uniref:enoyl-CoA hydratase/isomerase family protein n=1 Tax=Georgenia sp. SYP-B2076 TaxID=2495881 RepID=UPI0013DF2F21|nr:enoyl-CoA hydratase/isomerase family protein [Georgenia sp. SYP-B2076]